MIVLLCAGFNPDSDHVRNIVAGMDYAYTVNVTESQYGSWTKISLLDCAALTEKQNTPQEREAEEVGVTTCSQFLTQPPSEQQDSILRE